MANPVPPVPSLPFSPNISTDYLQLVVKTLVTILIDYARRLNGALMKDGSEAMTRPLVLAQFATADLPTASLWEGGIVYDSTTNTVKFSNGAVWTSM
jgi:hypothetical protein